MKVFFIDDRPREIAHLWQSSGCDDEHGMLLPERFESIEQVLEMAKVFKPEAILVGFGLSHPELNGADVIRALRENGFSGKIIANSGGGTEQFSRAGVEVDFSINRNPRELKRVMGKLTEEDER